MRNLHLTFVYSTCRTGEDFAKFCGLLRIYELYYVPSSQIFRPSYGPGVARSSNQGYCSKSTLGVEGSVRPKPLFLLGPIPKPKLKNWPKLLANTEANRNKKCYVGKCYIKGLAKYFHVMSITKTFIGYSIIKMS